MVIFMEIYIQNPLCKNIELHSFNQMKFLSLALPNDQIYVLEIYAN